jgi:hypothetical protein
MQGVYMNTLDTIKDLIAIQYPDFSETEGWDLQTLSVEMDEINETPGNILGQVEDLVSDEGIAFLQVIRENTRRLECPEGYLHVQVVKDNRRVLLMIRGN